MGTALALASSVRRAPSSLLLASIYASGCGGPVFESRADAIEPDSGSPSGVPTLGDAASAIEASVEAGRATPCGQPRTGDAPSFSGEICVESTTFTMGNGGQNLGGTFADHTPAHS